MTVTLIYRRKSTMKGRINPKKENQNTVKKREKKKENKIRTQQTHIPYTIHRPTYTPHWYKVEKLKQKASGFDEIYRKSEYVSSAQYDSIALNPTRRNAKEKKKRMRKDKEGKSKTKRWKKKHTVYLLVKKENKLNRLSDDVEFIDRTIWTKKKDKMKKREKRKKIDHFLLAPNPIGFIINHNVLHSVRMNFKEFPLTFFNFSFPCWTYSISEQKSFCSKFGFEWWSQEFFN